MDTLVVQLSLVPFTVLGHMGMIMDENNFRMYDEKVISNKCNYSIVVRMVKHAK